MISDTVIADTSEPCPTRRAGACATVRVRAGRGGACWPACSVSGCRCVPASRRSKPAHAVTEELTNHQPTRMGPLGLAFRVYVTVVCAVYDPGANIHSTKDYSQYPDSAHVERGPTCALSASPAVASRPSRLVPHLFARYERYHLRSIRPSAMSSPPLAPNVQNTLIGVQAMQQQEALLRVNSIADRCFHNCIDDFSATKKLRSWEESCIRQCVDKYLLMSSGAGNAFAQHMNSLSSSAGSR